MFQCPAQNLARFPQFCTRATVKLLVGCYEVPTLGTGVNHCAEAVSIRLNSGIPAGWIPRKGHAQIEAKIFSLIPGNMKAFPSSTTLRHNSKSRICYGVTRKWNSGMLQSRQGCFIHPTKERVLSKHGKPMGFYMGWNPHPLMPSLGSNRISNFRTCVNHRWVADNVGFHVGLLTSTECQSSHSINHPIYCDAGSFTQQEGKLILLMLNGSKATPSSFPSTSQLAPHPHSLPHNIHTEAIWQVQAKAAQLQLTTGASRLQHMTAYDYLNISRWSCQRVVARFQQIPPWRKNW